jgi:Na+-transporting NADH:ubiquinone oxidoreductase subunit F
LSLIEPSDITFTPGQYVQLQSNPYGAVKERVTRAYSIASRSSEQEYIDLLIRLVPEGICTTWVHEYLKAGDSIRFTGPMGDFKLHEGSGEIIMVAGGSGMAPMIPILGELEEKQISRKTTFFFGAGKLKDLFYTELMHTFEKNIPRFAYVPTLAEPQPGGEWEGETGLITAPLERYMHKISTSDAQGYLCGSPGMIKACIQVMSKYGLDKNRIYFDPFA